jgi:ElaB/YqjD/DUF883 family membrane-anchored ribosome-binding protein
MNDAPAAQVVELFADVDDLIRRVADSENPAIRKVRAKVYAALEAARTSYDRNSNQVRRQASPMAPRTAPNIGIALLVGLGVGLVVSLRQ